LLTTCFHTHLIADHATKNAVFDHGSGKKSQDQGGTTMSAPNGHAQEMDATKTILRPPDTVIGVAAPPYSAELIKELVAAMEVPFGSSQIEWRVMNTTKNQQPARGQIVPYADQRAYTDRLNALFTPAGWTRKYTIHTTANFERSKDQKIVAKVLVTCELTIFGVGSHSATGEEWADDDNAGTAAEAQAFKRAPAAVLVWAATFITSLAHGLTWTTASGQRQFLS
jgi:hypothetical protein